MEPRAFQDGFLQANGSFGDLLLSLVVNCILDWLSPDSGVKAQKIPIPPAYSSEYLGHYFQLY